MLLSSINKLANYTGKSVDPSKPGNDALKNRQRLLSWQASVSRLIETYCNRKFIIATYVEKFDAHPREFQYIPQAIPVVSITTVQADVLGRFDGTSDYSLNAADYRLGVDSMSLVLNWPAWPAIGGIQVTYIGGLAYHPVRSVFAYTATTGVPVAGNYVINDTQSAVGIVRVYTAGVVTIENLYGIFAISDVLSFATSEDALYSTAGSGQLTTVGSITAITQQSLAEAYPDLERACEIETRYMVQHQMDFENTSTMNDQTSRRQTTVFQSQYVFQPETLAILSRYRRIIL